MCHTIVNLYVFPLFFSTSWNLCGRSRYLSEYPLINYVWILKLAVSVYIIVAVFTMTLRNSQAMVKKSAEWKYYSKMEDAA